MARRASDRQQYEGAFKSISKISRNNIHTCRIPRGKALESEKYGYRFWFRYFSLGLSLNKLLALSLPVPIMVHLRLFHRVTEWERDNLTSKTGPGCGGLCRRRSRVRAGVSVCARRGGGAAQQMRGCLSGVHWVGHRLVSADQRKCSSHSAPLCKPAVRFRPPLRV